MDTPEVTGMSAKKGKARAPERGHRLRQARHRVSLTQEQLAEKVGVHRVSIARIEAGIRVPSMALGLRIASELDEPVEKLFGGER
jgi:putative transcriptional regulator